MIHDISHAFVVLLSGLTDLYILALMARLIIHWSRLDHYNATTISLMHITDKLLKPIKMFIPDKKNIISLSTRARKTTPGATPSWEPPITLYSSGSRNKFEIAVLAYIFTLETLKFFLLILLEYGLPNIFGIFILAAAKILDIVTNFYFFAIILQAILSWIPQLVRSPALYNLLALLTAPLQRPLQRIIPPFGNVDITPIIAIMLLSFVTQLIAIVHKAGTQIAIG